ncbi:MAG: hypothetical protein ACT4OE_04130 [Sphingosinicella sp.]
MFWAQFKIALSGLTGVSQDAYHVLVGVALQLFMAAVLRRRVSNLAPWLFVALLAILNEWADLWIDHWPDRSTQWLESLKDVAVTLALPTVLLVVSRAAPALFGPPVDDTGNRA